MNHINELQNRLFDLKTGHTFYEITNSVGQQWFISKVCMSVSLGMFQPSTYKGKLIKLFFPCLSLIGHVRNRLGIRKIQLKLNQSLQNLISNIFHNDAFDYSIFCGSPGVHRKITIQIISEKKILGYCKVTNQEEIEKIFENEHKILNYLHSIGIDQVPECLFCGLLQDDIYVFIQSTVKTSKSILHCKNEVLLWSFLEDFNTKSSVKCDFKETDYYRDMDELTSLLSSCKLDRSDVLLQAIGEVKIYFADKKTFSSYHGDFTPWNTFIEDNKLFAFDLEYFKKTYPPFLDYFHYYTQTAFYDSKWNNSRIYETFLTKVSEIKNYIDNPQLYYKAYILAIIHFYLFRDGQFNPIITRQYNRIWIDLLIRLNNEDNKQNIG
ncbi:MAG: hypothetical protein LBO74_12020 [Candidatus Symbiothrix sp.]|jgi:hypothetical protein|nr:hypothetical protein [Candidatus Symbiothrix sp.]